MESIPIDDSLQLTWLTRLAGARSPSDVAAVITALVQDWPGCETARVLWRLRERDHARSVPPAPVDAADWPWIEQAAGSGMERSSCVGARTKRRSNAP